MASLLPLLCTLLTLLLVQTDSLDTENMVDSVDTLDAVDTEDMVDMVDTENMVDSLDTVDTVDSVDTAIRQLPVGLDTGILRDYAYNFLNFMLNYVGILVHAVILQLFIQP